MSLSPLELKLPPGTPNQLSIIGQVVLPCQSMWCTRIVSVWPCGVAAEYGPSVIYVGCGAPKVSPGVVNACQTASLARQPPYP